MEMIQKLKTLNGLEFGWWHLSTFLPLFPVFLNILFALILIDVPKMNFWFSSIEIMYYYNMALMVIYLAAIAESTEDSRRRKDVLSKPIFLLIIAIIMYLLTYLQIHNIIQFQNKVIGPIFIGIIWTMSAVFLLGYTVYKNYGQYKIKTIPDRIKKNEMIQRGRLTKKEPKLEDINL